MSLPLHKKRPSKGLDITGKQFGYVTATRFTGKLDKHKSRIWHCKCICGNELEISLRYLRSPKVSCGCMKNREPGINMRVISISDKWIKRPLVGGAQNERADRLYLEGSDAYHRAYEDMQERRK